MSRVAITADLDAVVEFDSVTMRMPRRRRRKGAGRRQRLRRIAGEVRREELEVLRNVSFSIQPGESVAIIGPKGPGRQALLRLAAGTLRPDEGQVRRGRRIVPMIEVARALQRFYTVRQNIFIVGGLLGMAPEHIDEALPGIAEQAGVSKMLGRYMNAAPPTVRQKLAWSIAMSVDADAYAIDQTLVVIALDRVVLHISIEGLLCGRFRWIARLLSCAFFCTIHGGVDRKRLQSIT